MVYRVSFALTAVVILSLLWIRHEQRLPSPTQYRAQIVDANIEGAYVHPDSGALFFWGSDGVILKSDRDPGFRQTDTPGTGAILDLAGAPSGGLFIAVGEQSTLLWSTDRGDTWQQVEGLEPGLTLTAVVYLPNSDTWLAVGHDGVAAVATPGDPKRWRVSRSSITGNLLDVLLIPNTDKLVFAGESGLLGVSEDGGETWALADPGITSTITGLRWLDGVVLGLGTQGRLVLSEDLGESWRELATGENAHFNDAVFDPLKGHIVVTSSRGNVLVSADRGLNWRRVPVIYQDYQNYLTKILYDPRQKRLLVFGYFGTVAESTDGGTTWRALPSGHNEHNKAVAVQPESGHWFSAGLRGFKARGSAEAGTWHTAQNNLDRYWRDALQTPDGAITLIGSLGEIARSEDQGRSWQSLAVDYPDYNTPPSYRALAFNAKTQTLLAAGPTGLIMRSDDLGRSWQVALHTPFAQGDAFTDISFDPFQATAFALEAHRGPWVSEDDGHTWHRAPGHKGGQLWHSSLLPLGEERGSVIVAAGQQGAAALSYDGGRSWHNPQLPEALAHDLYGSYADKPSKALYLIGALGLILRSNDFGETWQPIDTPTAEALRHMIREPKLGALLCSGDNGTLLRSVDDGLSWQTLTSGTQADLRGFFIEPATDNILLIGRSGTIMRSNDAGVGWQSLPSHTDHHLRNAVFDQTSGNFIAFGERVVMLEKIAPR